MDQNVQTSCLKSTLKLSITVHSLSMVLRLLVAVSAHGNQELVMFDHRHLYQGLGHL